MQFGRRLQRREIIQGMTLNQALDKMRGPVNSTREPTGSNHTARATSKNKRRSAAHGIEIVMQNGLLKVVSPPGRACRQGRHQANDIITHLHEARAELPHQALPLASPQGPLANEGEALLTGISQRGLGPVEHQSKLSRHPFVHVSASAARRWRGRSLRGQKGDIGHFRTSSSDESRGVSAWRV